MSGVKEPTEIWKVWVDTGGTFTDCLALDPEGSLHRAKVLSSSALRGRIGEIIDSKKIRIQAAWQVPDGFFSGCTFRLLDKELPEISVADFKADELIIEFAQPLPGGILAGDNFEIRFPEEAPILAARLVTRTPRGKSLPAMAMRLATTRGTNALLERKGARVALFITRGFKDLLIIGNQQRPDLFALDIGKPEPLYREAVEVDERLAADGSVAGALDIKSLETEAERLLQSGCRTAAVALMHSYRNPVHEKKVAECLTRIGFNHVSCSSGLSPLIKILPRAETAVVNAYLSRVIEAYLGGVSESLCEGALHVMTSAGGLVGADRFNAKESLLSGPAGGVVGAAFSGKRSGFEYVIAFDMGGTSTDVARFDGDYEYVFEHKVGDANLVAPALSIESVAAGGGSICSFEQGCLKVGPESAGAFPGPACYGAGGPLTLTDVNLLLGRLDPERFEIPIVIGKAEKALEEITDALARQTGEKAEKESLLEGFLQIANERMADAIRRISVRRGYDPADYALVAFGGAGGQHACAVAGLLGIKTIIVPPDAGLLSALGLGHAVIERFAQRQVLKPLLEFEEKVGEMLEELALQAAAAVEGEGVQHDEIEIRRKIVNLRFTGQDSFLAIEFNEKVPLMEAFAGKYEAVFGYRPEGREVELESLRVVASSRSEEIAIEKKDVESFPSEVKSKRKALVDGNRTEIPVFERGDLIPGACINGPAFVFEKHSATVIEKNWQAVVDSTHALVLSRGREDADE